MSYKLGTDTDTGQLVYLPKAARVQGLYIVGLQGMGKSGLISNLVIEDIKQGTGVCVLDPHGELIDHVIARLPGKLEEDKVVFLDLADFSYPFGLNLFQCPDPTDDGEIVKTLYQVLHVFEKAYGIVPTTPLMYDLLYNTSYTLIANPGYTMIDIRLLLTNEACRKKLARNVPNADVQDFWRIWDDPKRTTPSEQEQKRGTILNKMNEFLHIPLRNIVGQSTTTFDLEDIMNTGKILLVKLSRRLEQPSNLIGSIIIAQLLNAAYARPTNKRRQFHLYADEFQNFATEDFATLLEEARKFGIGTTIAHQNRGQLNSANSKLETDLKDRSRSVGNMVVFKINSKDAEDLAGEFNIIPPIAETRREAVLIPKQNVIDHLLNHGHSQKGVSDFVTRYLYKLRQASEASFVHAEELDYLYKLRQTLEWPTIEFDDRILKTEYAYNPQKVKQYLDTLNHLLYLHNARKSSGKYGWSWVQEYRPVEQEVCKGFADVLGYYHYAKVHFEPSTPETKQAVERLRELEKASFDTINDEELAKDFDQWDKQVTAIDEQKEQCEEILKREGIKLIADTLQAQLSERKSTYKRALSSNLWFAIDHERFFYLPYRFTQEDILLDATYIYEWEKERFIRFESNLITVGSNLLVDPIMTESGKFEEKPLAPRTYADVHNEIANSLVGLPNFTARVKIASTNGTLEQPIKTLQPEKGLYGKSLQERIDRIRASNIQQSYLRDRTKVEAEIIKRQTSCSSNGSTLAQQQQPSPQTPRHARQVTVQGNCPKCGFSKNPSEARFCMQCGTKLN
jgi:hypothetical protein